MNWRLLILTVLLCTSTQITHATVIPDDPGNFITTWNTENAGTSNNDQITIPGSGAGYSYELYWEDTASSTINGTTTLITSSSYTHTFPAPGIYEVQASGTIPRIYFNNGGDKDKLLTIEQWGNIAWTSMDSAFYGSANLTVPATDAPDLSGVISMKQMFRDAYQVNQPIGHWDVSTIQNMSGLFYTHVYNSPPCQFNQDIGNWDVSSVSDISAIFHNCTNFNQDISNWDTSSSTNMAYMFHCNTLFNQDIGTKVIDENLPGEYIAWDVSNVIRFDHMFWLSSEARCPGPSAFNNGGSDSIKNWDTSSAVGLNAFRMMFNGATAFNQPVNTQEVTVGSNTYIAWDVSGADNISQMFFEARSFNQPLDGWNTSNVTRVFPYGFSNTFAGAESFDQNLSDWDISNSPTLTNMFENAGLSTTNQDATLAGWAAQTPQPNVPFHLGLKSYSDTGAAALNTLATTYNWDITEQYQATYMPSEDASLIGDNIQSPLDSGATTTAVTLNPSNNCEFLQWSDGNTDNPRQDVLTDNLNVTAELECHSSKNSTSASTQRDKAEKFGNTEQVEFLEDRFLTEETTDEERAYQPPATLEESLAEVSALDFTNLDPAEDKAVVKQLIETLLELVQVLTLLLLRMEG